MLPGMLNDQKRIAALILGKVDDQKEKKMDEPVDSVGLMTAAEEIISAVQMNKPSELRDALKSFVQLIYQEVEKQEEVGEEMGEGPSLIQDKEME